MPEPRHPEWVVSFVLPRDTGNYLYIKDKLRGRLVEAQLGGTIKLSAYIRSSTALEATAVFGKECSKALGDLTVRRVITVLTHQARQ